MMECATTVYENDNSFLCDKEQIMIDNNDEEASINRDKVKMDDFEDDVKRNIQNKEGKENAMRKRQTVSLLHSNKHTQILYEAMKDIHKDRDLLLSALLDCCGFIKQLPNFFSVIVPQPASRAQLEKFHSSDYLDLIEYPSPHANVKKNFSNFNSPETSDYLDLIEYPSPHANIKKNFPNFKSPAIADHLSSLKDGLNILDAYGLIDDCSIPTTYEARSMLWNYCLSVVGASLHASQLLKEDKTDVAIHWGGGRHHAHSNCASGFCYVNDVVLAIHNLIRPCPTKSKDKQRVLYIDLDIHHSDGVQAEFYDTNQVLTVSMHRYAPGFFPSSSGSVNEKGQHGTMGVGYNLNIPMPRSCSNADFLEMFNGIVKKLVPEYKPHSLVLCVGADGLYDDTLVGDEGWCLSPECLAECVRIASLSCNEIVEHADILSSKYYSRTKLLVLGAGGYNEINTARTFLLCTAAACEGARPGMLWKELPKDIPNHSYFSRYGPQYLLHSAANLQRKKYGCITEDYNSCISAGQKAIQLAYLHLKKRNEPTKKFNLKNEKDFINTNFEKWMSLGEGRITRKVNLSGRRHKKKMKNK